MSNLDGSSLHVESMHASVDMPCRICGLVPSKAFPHRLHPQGGWLVLDSRIGKYIWFPPTEPESIWNIFHRLGIDTSKVFQKLYMESEQL